MSTTDPSGQPAYLQHVTERMTDDPALRLRFLIADLTQLARAAENDETFHRRAQLFGPDVAKQDILNLYAYSMRKAVERATTSDAGWLRDQLPEWERKAGIVDDRS